jgi:uncharacterized membrane protein YuzA (DUF378 family)
MGKIKHLLAKLEIFNMKNLNGFDWVVLLLLIVGGLNWGMIGAFNIDVVSSICGAASTLVRVVYGLIGLSAIYSIYIFSTKTQ